MAPSESQKHIYLVSVTFILVNTVNEAELTSALKTPECPDPVSSFVPLPAASPGKHTEVMND